MALITRETARTMAAKSAEARRLRPLKAVPPGFKIVRADYPVPLPRDDSYVERRLARVRDQLQRLDGFLGEEEDPQKIDRLASAIARMSELERQLAGRPLPGSRRPKEEVEAKTSAAVAWLADSIDVPQVAPPAAPRLDPEPPAGPDAPTEPPADTPTGSVPSANQLPETPGA